MLRLLPLCVVIVPRLHSAAALRLAVQPHEPTKYPHTLKFLHMLGGAIRDNHSFDGMGRGTHDFGVCELMAGGTGYGGHPLCKSISSKLDTECTFLSYGIERDYTFDSYLEKEHHCRGVGMDPTVQYGHTLPGTNVTFRHAAAPGNHLPNGWEVLSPAQAATEYGMKYVSVLKMDCEGCEYALASTVAAHPSFFEHVGQFTAEFHFGNKFMQDHADVEGFEFLLKQLDLAGLQFAAIGGIGTCGDYPRSFKNYGNAEAQQMWNGTATEFIQRNWNTKCYSEIVDSGYSCGFNCMNVLFARTTANGTSGSGT